MGAQQDQETSFDEVLAPVDHRLRLAVIAGVALAAASSLLGLWHRVGMSADWIGLVATLAGGWPIWMEAWEAIRHRQINMEITMAMGVAAALGIGQFATAAVVVTFTLFSMYLEDLTKSRGKRALEVLLRAAPEKATVERDGRWVDLRAADVLAGERVLVKGGSAIPVDGRVVEGRSAVQESAITGEPFAKEKQPGDRVFAGTTNGNGTLEVEASRSGTDTTYARIVQLVREASARRGRTQRLADRVAQGIVYVVLTAALLTYAWTRNPITVVSVILVAGACGVAAGTPLAILATIAKHARRGVIVKGGETIEALARVDTVVLDKTGTLTRGEPVVERVQCYEQGDPALFLRTIASVEQGSDHPIARAILRASPGATAASGIQYIAGRGVVGTVDGKPVLVGNLSFVAERGISIPDGLRRLADEEHEQGRMVVYGAVGEALAGAIVLTDEIRSEAAASLASMRAQGLRLVMLTGDRRRPASDVAARLGIDEVHAELLPEDKIRIVRELKRSGRRVCFVGDGINDAPAIAEADVGVALQSGTEAAMETADVLLMTNDLGRLAEALADCRRTQRVILFNFGGTMVVDLAGIALAAAGLLGPLLAAIVHVGSELAFILNSARLFAGQDAVPPSG